jgi:hypothetical protein
MINIEKYYNDKGEVGVLYSPGYGAGWSSWAEPKLAEFLIFDKGLIEFKLQGETDDDKIEEYITNKLGDVYVYVSWDQVCVKFIKKGTAFYIKVFDGSESIEYLYFSGFIA